MIKRNILALCIICGLGFASVGQTQENQSYPPCASVGTKDTICMAIHDKNKCQSSGMLDDKCDNNGLCQYMPCKWTPSDQQMEPRGDCEMSKPAGTCTTTVPSN